MTADIHEGNVDLAGYYRNRIELTVSSIISADDLTEMLINLDEDHKRHVLDEIAGEDGLVGELFGKMSDDEQVELAHEHLDIDQITEVFKKLSHDDRMAIIDNLMGS